MEVKFTKEQLEVFLENYTKECERMESNLPSLALATSITFLKGCIGDMLPDEVKNDITNTIINVSTNTKTSVNELFEYLKTGLNSKLNAGHTEPRMGDIPKSVLDNKKLIKLFGYTPEIGIKEGLSRMIKK